MPVLGKNDIDVRVKTSYDGKGSKAARQDIQGIGHDADDSGNRVSRFGNLGQKAMGLLRVGAVAAAGGTIAFGAATAAYVKTGFAFNNQLEQAETKLNAFTGNAAQTAKTLAWVKDEAAKTQFSFSDMADAAANLTPIAKASGESLQDLIRQAEVLAAINPTEGLTGATFSLREALSGDWVSIVDRFNLPRKRINELKAQGVPAMEIISKTLKEMGIDYGLVSEQGKTTAARFDQLKDRFTIMAGEVTKPVFEQVGIAVENLANSPWWKRAEGNLVAMGEGAAAMFGRFNKAFAKDGIGGVLKQLGKEVDSLIPKNSGLRKAMDYLIPKFESLWGTAENKVLPTLGRLWKEVIEPLIPVVGTVLVGALGLAVDGLNLFLQAMTPLIDFILDNKPIVLGLATAFGVVAVAMNIGKGVQAFTTGIGIARDAISAFRTKQLGPLGTGLARFAGWGIFGGLAVAAAGMVIEAGAKIVGVLDRIAGKADDAYSETANAIKKFGDGKISSEQYRKEIDKSIAKSNEAVREATRLRQRYEGLGGFFNFLGDAITGNIPKNATGTNYSPGGLTMVGERGPELVTLPRGAKVAPASATRQTRSQAAAAPTVNNTFNIYNQVDLDASMQELSWRLAHVG